jgi:hypothetical protein
MADTAPFGYVAFRRDGLWDHARRLNPRGMMFLDDLQGAKDFARDFPDCLSSYRAVQDAENKRGGMLDYCMARGREVPPNVGINVGCEPGFDNLEQLTAFAAEALLCAQWAVANNRIVILLHLAHYGFTDAHWAILAVLMDYASKHRANVIIGVDEYGGGHMFSGVVDPSVGDNQIGHINPANWRKSPIPKNYHVGRVVTDCIAYLKAHRFGVPRFWITEHGLDALDDIHAWLQTLLLTPGYGDRRGWKSLQTQLQAWYGPNGLFPKGWMPGRAFGEMIVAARREIYKDTWNPVTKEGVELALIYCWRFVADLAWEQFDVSEATSFQQVLEGYREGSVVVTPTPPAAVAKPAGDAVQRHTINSKGFVTANVRNGPGTQYTDIGDLAIGKTVNVIYPNPPKQDDKYNWVWVEDSLGWVADVIGFAPDFPPEYNAATVVHRVPFLTQLGTGANNCGPATVAMWLNFRALNTPNVPVTVQQVDAQTHTGDAFNGFDDLIPAAKFFGLTLINKAHVTAAQIRAELNRGELVIPLVTRSLLKPDFFDFGGNHFPIVVGYGDTNGVPWFLLHDPLGERYGKGYFWKVLETDFMAAFNDLGAQALFAVPMVVPPPPPMPLPSHWRDVLSVREILQLELAETYAEHYSDAGVGGHSSFMLIAKLSALLDGKV